MVRRQAADAGRLPGMALVLTMLCAFPTLAADEGGAAPGGGSVRALIEARQHAVLSSEIAGRIARLPVEPGQSFKAGQLLVGFDCAGYQAELDAARAQQRAAEVTARVNRRLNSLKSIGEAEVELAEVKVDIARAEVRKAEVQARRCEVKAPYDGRVVDVKAREHESVPPGTPLLEILSDRDLTVSLIVPSSWLVALRPGQRFELRIDETGQTFPGEVTYLGAKVDPASQSVRVTAKLVTKDGVPPSALVAGMSGTAQFPAPPAPGAVHAR